MTEPKVFLTIDEQINLLKKRRLTFFDDDEEVAYSLLAEFGYYEIFNGYRDPFMENGQDKFLPNTRFHDVFQLFSFDQSLRDDVMSSIEMFELTFRQTVARSFARNYGESQQEYLNVRNYISQSNPNSLNSLIKKLAELALTETSQPFDHYRNKYGNVPPWIVVKGLEFWSLKTWYHSQKRSVKNEIIKEIIDESVISTLGIEKTKQLFGSMLQIVHQLRNRAAHGGRIYNFFPYNNRNSQEQPFIQYNHDFHRFIGVDQAMFRQGYGTSGVWLLSKLFQILKFKHPHVSLSTAISNHLISYFSSMTKISFNNMEWLLNEMKIPLNNELAWYVQITSITSSIDSEMHLTIPIKSYKLLYKSDRLLFFMTPLENALTSNEQKVIQRKNYILNM